MQLICNSLSRHFLLTAQGRGTIIDTIYEKRVNHVFELAKMDADITTTNDHIIYNGGRNLHGVSVKATDLRAGAALCHRWLDGSRPD